MHGQHSGKEWSVLFQHVYILSDIRVLIDDNRDFGMQSENPTNSTVAPPPYRSEAQLMGNAEKEETHIFNFI